MVRTGWPSASSFRGVRALNQSNPNAPSPLVPEAALTPKEDRFTGPIYFGLWGPAMLSSLGWALSDMADAVVVGQRIGTVGLAAIALILPVYMINSTFAHALGLGGSIRYARLQCEGRQEDARNCYLQVLSLTLALSAGIALLGTLLLTPLLSLLGTVPADGALFHATRDYLQVLVLSAPLFYLCNVLNYFLRNDNSQKIAGLGSLTGNLCDISLNILLVLVLGMGTRGAALATTLGQIITLSFYARGLLREGSGLKPALPQGEWLRSAGRMMGSGLSTSVQYFYQMIFFLICNNVLIRMGGETGVAVFDVIQNSSYLILYLYEGTARAMQPVLTTYHAEHNLTGQRYASRLGFGTGVATGSALIALIALWPRSMCLLFGIAGSAAEPLASFALRVYVLGAFFAGINILLCNFYQSFGIPRATLLLETLRGAVLLLPLTLLCSRFGLKGFWWLYPLTELGSLLLFLLMWRTGRFRLSATDPERVFQRTILSTNTDVGTVSQDLEAFCERWQATMRQQFAVTNAVEEVGLAILQHGFQGRTDGYIQVTVIAREDRDFELHLRDNAKTFNPFSLEGERATCAEDVDFDSLGILMLKNQSKEFFYRRYQGFNSMLIRI